MNDVRIRIMSWTVAMHLVERGVLSNGASVVITGQGDTHLLTTELIHFPFSVLDSLDSMATTTTTM